MIPAQLKRTGMEKKMLIDHVSPVKAKPDANLIKLVVKAFSLKDKFIDNNGKDIKTSQNVKCAFVGMTANREVTQPYRAKHCFLLIYQQLNGGEQGIRTLDTLPYTHFPGVRLRPLGQLSTYNCPTNVEQPCIIKQD